MINLKPVILFLTILLILFVYSISSVSATKSHLEHPKYKHVSENLVKNRHIVKFSKSQDADSFVQSINHQFSDVNIKILYRYNSSIFHGLSFHIDAPNRGVYSQVLNMMMDVEHVESIHSQYKMRHSGVKFGNSGIDLAIEPTDLINPHHMTQVKRVHEELQNKGKGVFIGIIDSGIDYNHPALGGGFGKGYKVAAGYDLVGDKYDPNDYAHPTEDDDPFDSCPNINGGHGTHVAGIIAGYDPSRNFSGVAPEATLGMWRVFSCLEETVNDDIILEAIVRAYEAGVDVINLSLGASTSWSVSASNEAINNVIAHGVVVVSAGGNSGTDAMYTFGNIAKAESVISVASIENDYFYGPNFKASGIETPIPYTLSAGNTYHFPSHSIPLVFYTIQHNETDSSEICSEDNINISNDNIKGSMISISWSSTCILSISQIAKEKGALGLIIFSNANSHSGSAVPLDLNITTFYILLDHGVALQKRAEVAGSVRIKLSSTQGKSYLNRNIAGGAVSGFSSVGPSAELQLIPEISGIGGAILSTIPVKAGGWMITQGTSMAAPYVAGSIGLYLASRGKKEKEHPLVIKEKFMNYAKPVNSFKSFSLDSPLRQGAGLLQVYDTITQTTQISPPKISFNDTATNLYKSHTLTINNWGSDQVVYRIHNNISVALMPFNESNYLSYYSSPVSVTGGADIIFSADIISIPAHESVNITVTVNFSEPFSRSTHLYYGGFINLKSQRGQQTDLSVPYFGVYGHQKNLTIYSPAIPIFLNDTVTSTIYRNTDKKSFKFDTSKNNTIGLVTSLVTPTRILKCELLDDQGDSLGYIPLGDDGSVNLYYVNRVTKGDSYINIYEVDSYYVPPDVLIDNTGLARIKYLGVGRYKLSALKLFGNEEIVDDWETWISGPVEFV